MSGAVSEATKDLNGVGTGPSSSSMMWHLVRKDLHLHRSMIVAALVAGALALVVLPLSPATFYIGSVSVLCVLVVLNLFLVFSGVTSAGSPIDTGMRSGWAPTAPDS